MAGGGGGEGNTWVWVLVAGVVLCGAGYGIEFAALELHWVVHLPHERLKPGAHAGHPVLMFRRISQVLRFERVLRQVK